jgi:hypothetical protein
MWHLYTCSYHVLLCSSSLLYFLILSSFFVSSDPIPFSKSLFFVYRSWIFMFFVYYCCAGWGYLGIYKSYYNLSNISHLNSSPSPFSLNPTLPHSWNSFNGYHFLFVCLHTHYLYYIHSLTPLTYVLPPPSGTNTPRGHVLPSCSLIFIKEKIAIFICLRLHK